MLHHPGEISWRMSGRTAQSISYLVNNISLLALDRNSILSHLSWELLAHSNFYSVSSFVFWWL